MDKTSSIENLPESRYINRELSWLSFNYRVLREARNPKNPLLERIRFLAISDKNLDEFYMVRVAGLKKKFWSGIESRSFDGLTILEQLIHIDQEVREMIALQSEIWQELVAELERENITIKNIKELDDNEKAWLQEYFAQNIFPILTPLAIDPAHPFPLIANDAFAIVLRLHRKDKDLNALIPLPKNAPRFINLEQMDTKFVPLEQVINFCFDRLFPGFTIKDHTLFHIIRNSDITLASEVDDDDDLVEIFRDALKRRRHGEVIRLTIDHSASESLLDLVSTELELDKEDIFHIDGFMNFSDVEEFTKIKRPDLLFKKYSPRFPERIEDFNYDYFAAIRAKDLVVHHPYESFDVVTAFLEQAAKDPQVIAIKQTLYRTSPDSPTVKTLIEAAERGKSVTVVIELKARFDEEANIRLSERLETAGVQVVYGFINFKTHCKVSIVVRNEGKETKIYSHWGTGNYNPITAQIYTDLSLFTCDLAIGRDAIKIFNYLTGYAEPEKLEKISISPINLQNNLINLIQEEIKNAQKGKPAAIWAKMNSLLDPVIIDQLYLASQAGVKIELVVRGICGLKPGINGLSENIIVKSIVGRFLEHSRIICFANGSSIPSNKTKVFISSSDWMQRSFHHRIETLVPLENITVHKQVLEQVMQANLKDDEQSWLMNANGTYTKINGNNFNAQEFFMTNKSLSGTSKKTKNAQKSTGKS